MKRTICILIVVFFLCLPLFAYDFQSSSRHSSMGGTGSADVTDDINYFRNPASVALYTDKAYKLSVSAGALDSFLLNSNEPFPTDPDSFLKVQFVGKNISAGMSVDFDLFNRVNGSGVSYYDVIKEFEFNVNIAGSIGHFSGGLGLNVSTEWKRIMIPVKNKSAMTDLIRESYFLPYFRDAESDSVNIVAGVLYANGSVSFGFTFDDIVSYERSAVQFDWTAFKNGINVAFEFSPQKYTKRGRLKPFVWSFAVEVDRFMDSIYGSLRTGFDFDLQLARNNTVSARIGYSSPADRFPNGSITAGLGYRIHNMDFSVDSVIPTGSFASTDRFSVGFAITALF